MDQYSGELESDFQATDTQREFRYKSGISGKLRFERVNEVTWKLTNGEMTNVPACHGFWGGYRTTKAIASVINVAANAWLARCGDQTSNPIPLAAAKSKAMAMAKGACGDYVMTNPIAHLNGITARLLDTGSVKRPGTARRLRGQQYRA